MGFSELLITAIALAMDAFAVSLCKGLATESVKPPHMLKCGVWFGIAQALMPLVGYLLCATFSSYITSLDHWIAFVLLGFIGANMIKEAFGRDDEGEKNDSFSVGVMATMALATSIDALAVGITFALLPDVNIWLAVFLIGTVTFLLSCLGVRLGNIFGAKYSVIAHIVGGSVLVLMAFKILFEHLGIIS